MRGSIAALAQIDRSLDEASATKGTSAVQTLRGVVLALLRLAMITALAFSFVHAMTAVSAVIFLVSACHHLATVCIVGRVEAGEMALAIAYSTALILIMLVAVLGIKNAWDVQRSRVLVLRRRVCEGVRDLQKLPGLTVVYVTHNQQEALAVSNLVCVMRAGKIVQMGTPRELYDEPADAFIADFMGEANVLEGEVLGPGRISPAGVALETRLRPHPPGPALLAIRPEAVRLAGEGEGLPGQIRRAAFWGQTHLYEVGTKAGQLSVVAPAGAAVFAQGDDLRCRIERVIPLRLASAPDPSRKSP